MKLELGHPPLIICGGFVGIGAVAELLRRLQMKGMALSQFSSFQVPVQIRL